MDQFSAALQDIKPKPESSICIQNNNTVTTSSKSATGEALRVLFLSLVFLLGVLVVVAATRVHAAPAISPVVIQADTDALESIARKVLKLLEGNGQDFVL
jgi:hypothetical protein